MSLVLSERNMMDFPWVLLVFLFFIGCKDAPLPEKPLQLSDVDTVICDRDSSQQYVAYVPSGYSGEAQWPVLFAFDPHARGYLPVDSFKCEAEQHGYILIGSSNIRNGLSTVQKSIEVLMEDVSNRYNIDAERIYLAGFSGGARIASIIALQGAKARGVVSCGAGLPGVDVTKLNRPLYFYGIVGNQDFNYQELMRFKDRPNDDHFIYEISVFNGGHQWPPAGNIEKALIWFRLNEFKEGLLEEDEQYIKWVSQLFKREIEASDSIRKIKTARQAINFLRGLVKVNEFEKVIRQGHKSPVHQKYIKDKKFAMQFEQRLRKELYDAFSSRSIDWWGRNIHYINNLIKKTDNFYHRNAFIRVKNYAEMMAFLFTSKAFEEDKSDEDIARYLDIYQMAGPNNADMLYFKARFFNRVDMQDSVLYYLRRSLSKGVDLKEKPLSMFDPVVLNSLEIVF